MDVFTGVLLLLLGAAPVMTATKNPVVETLHNTNATITAPEDPSGGSSYAPDARHLWILDMQQSDVNIEVTVQELDLGLPYTTIHETGSMVNYTEGDFLLIGAGPDILQGNEVMFYGSRRTPKKVVVRSGVGHIFFYSTQSITEAKGFIINYTMTDMATTLPPPVTLPPTPPPLSSAFISIKGIPVNNWWTYNDTFKQAVSNMASDYVHDDFNMTTFNVTPSEVQINDVKTCHPDFCPVEMCVTYEFSVAKTSEGEQVFDQYDLDSMLADPTANQYITEAFGGACQICDDDPSISVVLYAVIPLAVVLCGVGVTIAAWKLSDKLILNKSQERYEQAQKDRINDQRRRSSGDISILGVGGSSLASQGSRSSRRYTMPFPKPARDEVDHGIEEEDEEEVDTTGFIYYDPDQSITDPAQFGLGGVVSEFTRKGQGSHQYTNKAFVTDEEAAADIQRASFADDSDTDSDNGGALSFRPSRTEMTSTIHFEVPAEVHSPDAEGDTAL